MKQLDIFILEKLKINSKSVIKKDNFEKVDYLIDLGKIICRYIERKPLQDYITGKAEFDKKWFEYTYSLLGKIVDYNEFSKYSNKICFKIGDLFRDIIADNISDEELYNVKQNLLYGYKIRMGIIKESFEENTFWKIDKYFERNDFERKKFIKIIDYFRDHPGFTTQQVKEYIEEHEFKNLKKFIDFLDDIIKPSTTDRDYNHILYMLIKRIISDKNEGEKYTNKK